MMNSNRDRLTGLSYEELWNLIKSRKGDIEARRSYYGSLAKTINELNEIPQFRGKISPDDLDDAFMDVLEKVREPLNEDRKRELEAILHKRLGWERDYDFFDLGSVSGFPSGSQFGYGELRPLSKLPRTDQKCVSKCFNLAEPQDREHTRRGGESDTDENWFLCIRQRTIGWHNAAKRAEILATRSLAAYELVTGLSEFTQIGLASPPRRDFVIVCHDDSERSGSYHVPRVHQPIVNMPGFEDLIVRMTKLMRKDEPTELENRIMAIVDIFAMIQNETPPELKFLLKVICLEALLLSEDDRDYLGWKLAEKVAFILGDNKVWIAFAYEILPHFGFLGNFPSDLVDDKFVKAKTSESRRRLHKEVVRLYGKRSAFAHQQARKKKNLVSLHDYDMVSWLLRLSVVKMLALAQKGVTHLRKQSNDDPSSFDQLIEKLKY